MRDINSESSLGNISIYCVASPLHYLCATQIIKYHDKNERKILLYYRSGISKLIDTNEWKETIYAPWPRFDPLPGVFGKHRRLINNIKNVANLVGKTDEIHLHSPVFDTEAVNYYLHALGKLCGASKIRARILPDGVLNLSSKPMTRSQKIGQYLRRLRRLTSPLLSYSRFSGDRIGSDASFVDRIYTLPGLPSPYDKRKVCPIHKWDASHTPKQQGLGAKALIVGQPLHGLGILDALQVEQITRMIDDWLRAQGIHEVYYKPHPRDSMHEFQVPGSQV
ncbi:MAG: hypothetical protein ACKOWC_04485, partial [Limnohabitans sp.]